MFILTFRENFSIYKIELYYNILNYSHEPHSHELLHARQYLKSHYCLHR